MNWLSEIGLAASMHGSEILAQTSKAAGDQAPPWASFLQSPVPLVLGLLLVFLFISSRSKKAEERRKKEQLDSLKRGDRVQTIGGMLGKVVEVNSKDLEVLLKVDESSNTKIWFRRDAIAKVIAESKETDKEKSAELPAK